MTMRVTATDFPAAATKLRLIGLMLFAMLVNEALACPSCYYQRRLEVWPKIMVIKLVAAVLLTCNRLDPVRVCYTIAPYALLYPKLEMLLVQLSWPGMSHPIVAKIAELNLAQVAFNLPDALMLFAMGMVRFYRRDKERGLPIWQAVAYAVVAFALVWLAQR